MTDATADARGDARGDGDVLLELASLLAESVTRLERAGGVGAERLLELVRGGSRRSRKSAFSKFAASAEPVQLYEPVTRSRPSKMANLWC